MKPQERHVSDQDFLCRRSLFLVTRRRGGASPCNSGDVELFCLGLLTPKHYKREKMQLFVTGSECFEFKHLRIIPLMDAYLSVQK